MSQPKVCVTVTGKTTRELRQRRDAAVGADLIELRLDGIEDLDVAGALQGRSKPAIVTCRAVRDGGNFAGSESDRSRILLEAFRNGAEYVDIEWTGAQDSRITEYAPRVVLSWHEFEDCPRDLTDRYRAMRATGAAVVKIAVGIQRLVDLLPLAALGKRAAREGERAAMIGMGGPGVSSRILAGRFGACWTYAGSAAPGQIDAVRLVKEFRFRDISDTTEIYGVVGNPVMHSVSPAMHNAGFTAISRDAVYIPLEAADVHDFFDFAEAFGITGASVTAPFKQDVYRGAQDVDMVGRRLGAVNTVRATAQGWAAMNSDVGGFLEPLQEIFNLSGARATVIGGGGAAKAASAALVDAGASVQVCARCRDQAEEVASVSGATVDVFPPRPGSWDLLVNATPIGMVPRVEESPVSALSLDGSLVYDLVYNPQPTLLMREAALRGCRTLGGLAMLVAQAKQQFEWWMGIRPPESVFEDAACERLTVGAEETL